jgi:hypothetical protein
MLHSNPTRRTFVKGLAIAGGSALLGTCPFGHAQSRSSTALHVACNQFAWEMFWKRENRSFDGHALDTALAEVAKSGMNGLEPIIATPEQIDQYGPQLKAHGLEMRSLYIDSSRARCDQALLSIPPRNPSFNNQK